MRIDGPELDGSFGVAFASGEGVHLFDRLHMGSIVFAGPDPARKLIEAINKTLPESQRLFDGFDQEADEQRSTDAAIAYHRRKLTELEGGES